MSHESLSQVKPLRVVAVDDHEDTLGMLELLLGEIGWHVWTASTGEDALQIVERELPDLILSDLSMPDMDGFELIRAIRERTSRRIPAVAITGSSLPEDVELALAAGFDRHVTKPVSLPALLDAVREIVENGSPQT